MGPPFFFFACCPSLHFGSVASKPKATRKSVICWLAFALPFASRTTTNSNRLIRAKKPHRTAQHHRMRIDSSQNDVSQPANDCGQLPGQRATSSACRPHHLCPPCALIVPRAVCVVEPVFRTEHTRCSIKTSRPGPGPTVLGTCEESRTRGWCRMQLLATCFTQPKH